GNDDDDDGTRSQSLKRRLS
ncbi:unnamed protein product, partial [Rotaria sp. Silwood2]